MVLKICRECKKSFYVIKSKRYKRSFCSHPCYWKFLKGKPSNRLGKKSTYCGKKHWHWRGGKKNTESGYIMFYSPDHPFRDKQGYVREHRLVMEKHLGRYLNPSEIVHHINGVKSDNRLENLQYFENDSSHKKYHVPKGSLVGVNNQ